jgi:integrase/recombinase XerD
VLLHAASDGSALALSDLDPGLIGAFLDQSEKERGNSARSRNLRLTAIRSFFRYASFEDPSQSGLIQRVLAMPSKRYEKKLVSFLTRPEIEAVLSAPDRNTWAGRRDHIFLLVAVQTGLRLSEMTGLRREDVALGTGAHLHCLGRSPCAATAKLSFPMPEEPGSARTVSSICWQSMSLSLEKGVLR